MKKENFFNRKQYLQILEKRILALKDGYRQNLAIIGDESVGKSSLIFKFLDNFFDPRLITVYLEIRPEALAVFTRRFIGVLLYNFLLNSGLALEEDLDFLMHKASSYIPSTVEKARAILSNIDKRKREGVFSDLLSLCENINQESNKFCVVIFDEFQNLEQLGAKNIYSEWSKLLIAQKKTLYVILSSRRFKAQLVLSRDLSLLFGNFEVVLVEPFDLKETEEYLENTLPRLSLNKGLKNFIAHFTGGYPLYLQVLCQALLDSSGLTLVDILENLLFNSSGILYQKFSNYLKKFQDERYSQDYISIMHLIAGGNNKLKDIIHLMHKPAKELNARLEKLLELDTISRCGDFFKINDRVFGFWLKFVYQEKIHSLTFDAKNQKAVFRKSIENMLKEFFVDTNKSVGERIMLLLRLFDDDTMQIDKKRLKLHHFREIKPLEFNKRNLRDGLICRSGDNLWIIAFKYEALTEEDVSDFAKECKKYRNKTQKKIIVSFKDIDPNSRLKALEEKILTWDVDNLNQIMDLFSRPRIIV